MKKSKTVVVELDPEAKGELKSLGGSSRDAWNLRLSNLVASALPVNHKDTAACQTAAKDVFSGIVDINPTDPIEGMLIAQLVAANEAALSMYRRGWAQPSEYLEARLRYLALADKATRTVALLSERLDQHRNRGQQQITVKHVTVNAENAMVADSITTGNPADAKRAGNFLTASADTPMSTVGDPVREAVPVGGGSKQK